MQLLIFCRDCGVRPANPDIPASSCDPCADWAEADADIRAALREKRAESLPAEPSLGYEAELMGVPGSRSYKARQGYLLFHSDS